MAMPSQDDNNHANDEMGVLFRGNVNNIVKKFAQHANQNNHPRESKMQSKKRGQPSINTKNTRYNNNSNDITTTNPTYENNNGSPTSSTNSNTEQTTSSPADNMVDRKINNHSKGSNNVRSANTAIKQAKNQQDTSPPDIFKIKLKKVGIEKLLQKDEDSRKGSVQDQQSSDNSSQSWVNTFNLKPTPKRTHDDDDQRDERSSDPLPNTNRQQSSHQHHDDNVMPSDLNDPRNDSNISIQTHTKIVADSSDGDGEENNDLPSRIDQNPKFDITNPSSNLSNFTKANYVPPPAPVKQTDQLIEPKINSPTSLSQKSKAGGSLVYSFAKTGKKKNSNTAQAPNKSQNNDKSYDNFHRTSGPKVNNRPTKNDSIDDTTTHLSLLNTTKKNMNTNAFSNFAKKKSSTATSQKSTAQQNNSELQISNDNKQPSSPKSNLKSSSTSISEGKAHVSVTFSNSQPQIDYTYSPNEYERVIDIDAGLNEAQFEVEKSLRNMDLTTVELNKCK